MATSLGTGCMSAEHPPRLVAVEIVILGKSRRWIAENARRGRIAGARKIGQAWFIDLDAFAAANDTQPMPGETSVDAQVRARFRCSR